jgi:hypothetical protein
MLILNSPDDRLLAGRLLTLTTIFDFYKRSIAFPVGKRYIVDGEKLNQQRFNCATQVWETLYLGFAE